MLKKIREEKLEISEQRDFLQSEEWRIFQEKAGHKVLAIQTEAAIFSMIEHQLWMMVKYFYLPYGPKVFSEKNSKEVWKKLVELAKKEGISWVRFEPENELILEKIRHFFPNLKIKKAPRDVQPRELFVLDLKKSPEELLLAMKAKTRYNIKLAEKKGVKVKEISLGRGLTKTKKELDHFLRLIQITANRKGITVHPEDYYQKMADSWPAGCLSLFLAEYQGKIIAANLVVFFRKTAIYLHGASDDRHRQVMAPFLLQWRQILRAQERGCEQYDLGGVAIKQKKSGWEGITRFKIGFSPQTESQLFPGTFDLVLKPFNYFCYICLRKIKFFFSR